MITTVAKLALTSLIALLGVSAITIAAVPSVDTLYETQTSLESDGMIRGISEMHTIMSNEPLTSTPRKAGTNRGAAMYSENMISGVGKHIYSGATVLSSSNTSKYNLNGERFVSTSGPGTLLHSEQYGVDEMTDPDGDEALCPGAAIGAATKQNAKQISSMFSAMGASAVLSNGSKTTSGRVAAFPEAGKTAGVEFGIDANGVGSIDVDSHGFVLTGDKAVPSGESRVSERVGAVGKFNLSKSMSFTHKL